MRIKKYIRHGIKISHNKSHFIAKMSQIEDIKKDIHIQ